MWDCDYRVFPTLALLLPACLSMDMYSIQYMCYKLEMIFESGFTWKKICYILYNEWEGRKEAERCIIYFVKESDFP